MIDAAAAASIAALDGDVTPVLFEDITAVLALLDERRANLAKERNQAVNQLHALLRDLVAGGAPKNLGAPEAAAIIRRIRPRTAAEHTRRSLAVQLVRDLRWLDARIAVNLREVEAAVALSGSSLTSLVGIGPVLAARFVGRTGHAARFASGGHYASYVGVAPIEVASADHARHRLSRAGDRQLNAALHIAAIVQARTNECEGQLYFRRKIAEGKTTREALRCLKRRIAEAVWRTMLRDERARSLASGVTVRATA